MKEQQKKWKIKEIVKAIDIISELDKDIKIGLKSIDNAVLSAITSPSLSIINFNTRKQSENDFSKFISKSASKWYIFIIKNSAASNKPLPIVINIAKELMNSNAFQGIVCVNDGSGKEFDYIFSELKTLLQR